MFDFCGVGIGGGLVFEVGFVDAEPVEEGQGDAGTDGPAFSFAEASAGGGGGPAAIDEGEEGDAGGAGDFEFGAGEGEAGLEVEEV